MKLVLLLGLLSYVSGQPYYSCTEMTLAQCLDTANYGSDDMCCEADVQYETCVQSYDCPTDSPTTSEPTSMSPTPGPTTSEPICYCTTETPLSTPSPTTPSPTTKSYAKKTKGSTSSGTSCGECDCDKDYGVVELRFIYQGSSTNNNENVDIDIFDKDALKICAFTDVAVDEEIICTIEGNQGGSGKTDFDTETYIDIMDAATGDSLYTGDSFHTSCSSDIVGLTIYDDSIISSGWKDGNPDGNDCDDCQEECSCDTTTTAPVTTIVQPSTTCYCPSTSSTTSTTSTTPSPTTKSYAKKTKGSSTGSGYGDCDCDKDYGVVELRFIYQGTDSNNQGDVDINIYYDDNGGNTLLCSFNDVAVDDEITCTIDGNQAIPSGLGDFATETYIDIIDAASGTTLYNDDSFHTSCSSDIVGLTIYDDSIISSGWKDGNPDDGNDCDDGQIECECVTLEPFTTTSSTSSTSSTEPYVEPTVPNPDPDTTVSDTDTDTTTTAAATVPVTTSDQVCYCSNSMCSTTTDSPLVTPSPTKKSKGKSAKSKGGKSKSSSSDGMGCGDCDCDKDYGMVELRVLYSGSVDVTIEWYDKGGDSQICADSTGITQGTEATCNVDSLLCGTDPCYDKLETNTFAKLVDSNGDEVCTTEIHTSCSSDIVGTYGDGDCGMMVLVTGWKDGNPDDDNDCDDGYEVCPCIEEDGSANEEANDISYIAGQLADNDYAAYIEQQANAGSNSNSNGSSSIKVNFCAFMIAFVIIKLF